MNQKKSRISVKISLYIAIMQILAMLCLFLFISFSVSENLKRTAINTMQTISADRARIINDYIRSSEEFLTAYSRAGESGRGFAVVADEIRKLADESAQSAGDIELLIDELVNNSDASIAETIKLNNILEKQKEELRLTHEGFENLKKEVILVENASKRINNSNETIEKDQKTLSDIVENLSAISEENAASCEETNATMESVSADINRCREKVHALTRLSESLKSQVSHFKL